MHNFTNLRMILWQKSKIMISTEILILPSKKSATLTLMIMDVCCSSYISQISIFLIDVIGLFLNKGECPLKWSTHDFINLRLTLFGECGDTQVTEEEWCYVMRIYIPYTKKYGAIRGALYLI